MAQHVSSFEIRIEQTEGFVFDVHFDKEEYATLRLDEPAPLSGDDAPNAVRILAAAVGNCLAASLVFCAKRRGLVLHGVAATVKVELVRNERRRLRVGKVDVRIDPGRVDDPRVFDGCLEAFEDFCVVTQSVRDGLHVDIEVARPAMTAEQRVL